MAVTIAQCVHAQAVLNPHCREILVNDRPLCLDAALDHVQPKLDVYVSQQVVHTSLRRSEASSASKPLGLSSRLVS